MGVCVYCFSSFHFKPVEMFAAVHVNNDSEKNKCSNDSVTVLTEGTHTVSLYSIHVTLFHETNLLSHS